MEKELQQIIGTSEIYVGFDGDLWAVYWKYFLIVTWLHYTWKTLGW